MPLNINPLNVFVNPLVTEVAEPFSEKNNAKKEAALNGAVLLTVFLVLLIQVLPVVLIAVNCNPKHQVMYGILAFLFPGIYLFQHALRKYVLVEKGYCGN